MSNKQKQRTKGNVRPSSSGRAAELLAKEGGGHVGFVGFGSMSGDLGYVPTNLGFEDQDASLDSDFRMVLRKLSKRDVVTKLKAIQEFRTLCIEKEEKDILTMLPHWPRLYNRLSLDHDKRVREATQHTFEKVVLRVKRNLAPHLRSIMGCWLMAQNDPYAPAASAARSAFGGAFTSQEKRGNAVAFCKGEVLQLYKDNLFKETATTLSDPKSYSKDEQEEKYLRVVSSSLLALREFIDLLPEAQYKDMEEELSTILAEDRLWKLTKHKSPMIRGAMYSLLGTFCQCLPGLVQPYLPKLSPALLSSLDESEPATVQPLWEAVLRLVSSHKECWKHVNMRKAVLPKLWSLLRQGGNGCASVIYPHLLPLLSHLPSEVIGQGVGFYREFFGNFREGCTAKSVLMSSSENVAVLKSLMECLRYCLTQKLTDDDEAMSIQHHLVEEQMLPILRICLTEEAKGWSVVTIFQQTAALLNFLHKQQSGSPEKVSPLRVLESLWRSISDMCTEHVARTDPCNEHALQNVGVFVAIVKNPDTGDRAKFVAGVKKKKKGARIRFADDTESEAKDGQSESNEGSRQDTNANTGAAMQDTNRAAKDTPLTTSPAVVQHPELSELVQQLVKTSFSAARHQTSLPHLEFLSRLVGTFSDETVLRTLLETAGVEIPSVRVDGNLSPSDKGDISPERTSYSINEDVTVSDNVEEERFGSTSPSESISSSSCQGQRSSLDATGSESAPRTDSDHLPLCCIHSLLLPWLLDVERDVDAVKRDRHAKLDAILDMVVAVMGVCRVENQPLVVDALCLKAHSSELLHLIVTKVRDKPESTPFLRTWLRSDVFGEKLLSLQGELCRLSLEGHQQVGSVGWQLITLALSSAEDEEPVVGTAYAELLLVGFYRALTRPDVMTTATHCISFICDVTANFFSVVKGCIHLSSTADLLLAIMQLECREAKNLSGSLKEKVHQTWFHGIQTLVRQTGGLLSDRGLLVNATQWIKQTLFDKDGNIHQSQQLGDTASSFLEAVFDGLPGDNDASLAVMNTLLESLLPTHMEWVTRRQELPTQWMATEFLSETLTFCNLRPLTCADKKVMPQALNLAMFVAMLLNGVNKDALQEPSQEEEDVGWVTVATSWLPWGSDILQTAILEVVYCLEWCRAVTGVDALTKESHNGIVISSIKPPSYCMQSASILKTTLNSIWRFLNPVQWQALFSNVLEKSLMIGGLWSCVLDHVILRNGEHNDAGSRFDVWHLISAPERQWYEIANVQMLQTLESLLVHCKENERQEFAEINTALLLSAEEGAIPSICGGIGNITVLVKCANASASLSDGLSDLLLSALRQLQLWREQFNAVFIFSSEELEGASSELLCANMKMIQLVTIMVEKIPERLESHDWDFILCSLVSWIQACCENTALLQSSLLTAGLCLVTCNLLSSTARLLGHTLPPVQLPPNLMTEWVEFFSDGAYSVLLPAFIQFLDSQDAQQEIGVDLSLLLESMCEAVSHAPAEQLKGHRLPVKLEPGSSKHVPDTMHSLLNHLVPLLGNQRRPVQMSAYKMLDKVMPEFAKYDEEYLQVKNKSDADNEDEAPSISPPSALQRLLDLNTAYMEALLVGIPVGECTVIEPGSEAYVQTRSYLLGWRLYLTNFKAASMEVRAQYSAYLKKSKGVHSLLDVLFRLMPEDPVTLAERSSSPSKAGQATMFSKKPELSAKGSVNLTNEVQHLACSAYFSILQDVPAIARQWWNLQDRRIAPYVDRFTTKYVSPLLCAEEIHSVQNSKTTAENLTVRARLASREVTATYSMQDLNIEMTITLPTNHPLGPIEVDNRKKVAVGTSQWRQWTLMLTTFLTHQNGSIMEGLNLWRSNADKRFEGIEDCMICFSVIHGGNCSLPKLTCKTCKKKFHSACLYKWFSTSTQSSCPLCRSPF